MNALATFMETMNNLFCNMLDSGLPVFLDNILVYLHAVKEHFTLLKKVLACLYQCIFYCKLKKCSLLCNSIIFLSVDITTKGMHISDSKVQSLNKWPVASKVK